MKVVLYMAITVNGMIAREDNDTSFTSKEDWASFRQIAEKIGNLIIGRKTYELMEENQLWDKCQYIVVTTNTKLKSTKKNVSFTNKTPKEILQYLENLNFNQACVAGGSKLNTSFIKESLIDEIYLAVEPAIISKGISIFTPDDFEYQLELLKVKKLSPQTIQLRYKVNNDKNR